MLLNEIHGDAYQRLSDQQFEMAFNAVKNEEMDIQDLKKIAQEFEFGEYGRTKGSALFTLARMHILVHGVAPTGITEKSAETMFHTSKPIEDFIARKGYDIEENVRSAQEEWRNRPKKVKEPQARQMVWDYFNKNGFRGDSNISAHKEDIVRLVMTGVSPEQAFAKFSSQKRFA